VEVVTRARLELVCSLNCCCLSVPVYACVCVSVCVYVSVCVCVSVCTVKRRRYDECELFDDKSRDELDVNTEKLDHPGDCSLTSQHIVSSALSSLSLLIVVVLVVAVMVVVLVG